MIRREVGTVRDVDIVPKLVSSNLGWGWWSGIPVAPRIMTGGWGDGSGVTAHVESPVMCGKLGVRAGEGVRGTYGVESAEPVGVMMTKVCTFWEG